MKQTTVGVFEGRAEAEKAISHVHDQYHIPADDIAFLYRNTDGEVKEVKTDLLTAQESTLSANVLMGATVCGAIGLLTGFAAISGYAPFVRTALAMGNVPDLLALLHLTGTAATLVATTVLGAILGVILGAIGELLLSSSRSRSYSDQAEPKNIVVAVIAPERVDVISMFRSLGAFDARVYRLSI